MCFSFSLPLERKSSPDEVGQRSTLSLNAHKDRIRAYVTLSRDDEKNI